MSWSWLIGKRTLSGKVVGIRNDQVFVEKKGGEVEMPVHDFVRDLVQALEKTINEIYEAVDERGKYVP